MLTGRVGNTLAQFIARWDIIHTKDDSELTHVKTLLQCSYFDGS